MPFALFLATLRCTLVNSILSICSNYAAIARLQASMHVFKNDHGLGSGSIRNGTGTVPDDLETAGWLLFFGHPLAA